MLKHLSNKRAAARNLVLASAVFAVLSAGCSHGHMRVRSYWATTLERMPWGSTYDWFSEANVTTSTLADPELHGFTQREIERGLADLGYVHEPGGEPDFLISYRSSMGVESTSWGPANKALLAIQAHRPGGRVIWRGWAEGEVDTSSPPEVRRERLHGTIRRILEEFRPAGGS